MTISKSSKIFVAGHNGLLGSAIMRVLLAKQFSNLITCSRQEVDYFNYNQLETFFKKTQPEYVFLAAGRTGGILANKSYPADFLYENLAIQTNFFMLAQEYKVKALVFYASSCVYPKNCPQPMQEKELLNGHVEPTSQAYAAAKLAGIYGCWAYNQQYSQCKMICLLPNSLYGPKDNFSLENSHVLSAMIRKIHDAKIQQSPSLTLWGTGSPKREFVFSEDAAEASLFAVENMDKLANQHYNIGSQQEASIKELADMIAQVIGYKGKITFDTEKPDGAPRKLLDSSLFNKLGWNAKTDLEKGIQKTYEWFRSEYAQTGQ